MGHLGRLPSVAVYDTIFCPRVVVVAVDGGVCMIDVEEKQAATYTASRISNKVWIRFSGVVVIVDRRM